MSDEATLDGQVTEVDAVVIGSGFAGLYSMHRLRNVMGLEVQGFDNAGGVGGTWYWNRYPGARSDTEVNAYCYSFDKDLFHEWKWSERYPRQSEILAYLNHVADRHDLTRSYRFNTQVTDVTWDEENNRYLITTDDGGRYAAQFLVEAVGLSVRDQDPRLPGAGQLRRRDLPHRPVAAREGRARRQEGRCHRHRLQRHPGDLRARA